MPDLLPSWRPGATRDAIIAFLDAAESVPVEQRVACLDNDGTLWSEKPSYVQLNFFVDAMKRAVGADPTIAEKPEFAALISGDQAAIGEVGLERIAHALTGLFEGEEPQEFTARVREFMSRHDAPTFVPMLELVDELRRREFTVCVVTGGGTEFVRAVSQELYGVPPQNVVGSLIAYEFVPTADDGTGPRLRRTSELVNGANEGAIKVTNIQTQLGRRPIIAVGNSGGDREMLEWAAGGDGPTLALLVNHDDAVRETAYVSSAVSFADPEPITDVGGRLGWTIISMAADWVRVFSD
jgi:hypothetical protein